MRLLRGLVLIVLNSAMWFATIHWGHIKTPWVYLPLLVGSWVWGYYVVGRH